MATIYNEQTWTSGSAGGTPLNGSRLQHMEDGIAAAPTRQEYGTVPLEAFAGANHDAMLSAAMSALAAETYPRTLTLGNQLYQFSTGNIVPFDGFRLKGAWGYSNPERNSGAKVASPVQLSTNGPWFTSSSSTIYSVSMSNLALEKGTGTNSTFIGGGTGQFYCLQLRDIYSSGLRSILGTQSQKLLFTAAHFSGSWEINNCYSGAFHVGGSDSALMWDQMLLDSGTAFATAGGSAGQAHFWADGLDKTIVGPMYITAEGAWRGIRHDGSALNSGGTNSGSVQYLGLRLEGRNPSQPCNGSLFVQNGGHVRANGIWMAYGMSSPSAGENGAYTHNSGSMVLENIVYDCTNQAQTTGTPMVWTAGGTGQDCIVRGIGRASRGAVSWGANRPIVARASAGAENRILDGTVTGTVV